MISISAITEPGVVTLAVVLFVALWAIGVVALSGFQNTALEAESTLRGAEAMASEERHAVSKEDVERWAIRLEADRQLPPGWTARDAARLLRIRARRQHLLTDDKHL